MAVAGAVDNVRPAQDLLNVDCWEKVFDYLSFEGIYNMSQTCTRLRQIAGKYAQSYFPDFRGVIRVNSRSAEQIIEVHGLEIFRGCFSHGAGLNEFIDKLDINCVSNAKFKLNRRLRAESFPSVKKLTLSNVKMTESEFYFIGGILGNIEALQFEYCKIDGHLFVRLLQMCPKLKSLRVAMSDSGNHWLHDEYPTLENVEIVHRMGLEPTGAEMVTFLMNNSNIKRFGTESGFIWANRQALKEADIQLDCLAIEFGFLDVTVEPFISLLGELHERQFYSTLHFHTYE